MRAKPQIEPKGSLVYPPPETRIEGTLAQFPAGGCDLNHSPRLGAGPALKSEGPYSPFEVAAFDR